MRGVVEPKEYCILHKIDESGLTPREVVAVQLAERVAGDPHTVDDTFFSKVKEHFSEEEIVEMVFATSIFNWGNKFNITLQMDTSVESPYESGLQYETYAPGAA